MGSELDKAAAETGPKIAYTPGWAPGEVEERGKRISDIIATIKTPKEQVLEVMDGIEAVMNNPLVTAAVGSFAPQAIPILKGSAMGLDLIEEVFIKRQKPEITAADVERAIEIYGYFKKPKPTDGDGHTDAPPSDHSEPPASHHPTHNPSGGS